jgi:hypothetical protein
LLTNFTLRGLNGIEKTKKIVKKKKTTKCGAGIQALQRRL